MNKKLTKEEFLEKLKTDRYFNNRYGRKHITEGKMVLPPCHYGFQVYTTEMTNAERCEYWAKLFGKDISYTRNLTDEKLNDLFCPKRKISLMWNQRSVDVPLGLPFNIASYGLLLSLIGKIVNMVPDQLIGNLGDTHIYLNQIEGCKEQIGRDLTIDERFELWNNKENESAMTTYNNFILDSTKHDFLSGRHQGSVPKRTREPFPLPTLNINTEFWLTEGGECGIGLINANAITSSFNDEHFCKCLLNEDIQLENYVSHPTIKFPLSN